MTLPSKYSRLALIAMAAAGALLVSSVALMAISGEGDAAVGAEGGKTTAPPEDDVCDQFLASLESQEPVAEVVARFGLPLSVPAPSGVTVDNVYCFGRQDEVTGIGVVLAVAVEDRSAGDVWLILSAVPSEFSTADWRITLGDYGWNHAVETAYGFATRPGGSVELWSEVSRQRQAEN